MYGSNSKDKQKKMARYKSTFSVKSLCRRRDNEGKLIMDNHSSNEITMLGYTKILNIFESSESTIQ